MSEKVRVPAKPEAKSDNSAFHALTPHSSQFAHSPFGTRSLITRELSGLNEEDRTSHNLKEPASCIPKGYDFSRIRIFNKSDVRNLPIQPKLRINKPGDVYEEEADRVADAVMRMEEPGVRRQVEEEEEETLQAKEIPSQIPEVTPNLEARINTIRGSGQPLPESTRAFFESRFGHDFSQVRVHTDTLAAESAREVNARAFTVGQNVVFGVREYSLGTTEGRRLLAHELTHIVQQKEGNDKHQVLVKVQDSYYKENRRHTPIIVQANKQPTIAPDQPKPQPAVKDIKLRGRTFDPDKKEGIGTDHVASIWFFTKDYRPDPADSLLLKELAKTYQYSLSELDSQDLEQKVVQSSLKVRVVGHADIRPSVDPGNDTLSHYRARSVAQLFWTHLELLFGPGAIQVDLDVRGEGVTDCLLNSSCRHYDPDALSRYRRADVYIEPKKVGKPKPEREMLRELRAKERERAEDAINHLIDRGVPWELIRRIGWKVAEEIAAEFIIGVGPGLAIQNLCFSYENALIGRNFVLSPLAHKAFAYGATNSAFQTQKLEVLKTLRPRDLDVLVKGYREPYWVEKAQMIWEQGVVDGWEHMFEEVYKVKIGERTSKDKVAIIQSMVRHEYDNEPKRMAKELCLVQIEKAMAGVEHPANIEKAKEIFRCNDYPH